MYCSACGTRLADEAHFCSACGVSINVDIAAMPALTVTQTHSKLAVMACAVAIATAFFLPWFSVLGVGASAYDLTKLGSYALIAWIIPSFAGLAFAVGVAGKKNKWPAIVAGTLPLIAVTLLVTLSQQKQLASVGNLVLEGLMRSASIGLYMTLLASILIIAFAAESLIEVGSVALVLVVTCFGTFAVAGSYSGYKQRAKLSEVVLAASACRTTVTEIYQSGTQPHMAANGWSCESLTSPSRYVRQVTTDENGKITVTAQNISEDVDGRTVTLFPADSSGAPLSYKPGLVVNRWICGGAGTTIPLAALPGSCRGGQ
jgi:type IV pilus assembly protein PilA